MGTPSQHRTCHWLPCGRAHRPPHRDDFDGVLAHVKVKDRAGICQNIPKRARGFDDRGRTFIVEPGDARATSISDRSASRAMNWICVLFPTLIRSR